MDIILDLYMQLHACANTIPDRAVSRPPRARRHTGGSFGSPGVCAIGTLIVMLFWACHLVGPGGPSQHHKDHTPSQDSSLPVVFCGHVARGARRVPAPTTTEFSMHATRRASLRYLSIRAM